MLTFPQIDPVLLHIGPLSVHWYGIAYVVSILAGWRYAIWIINRFTLTIEKKHFDDFIVWALIGIVLGGRLGHVLFFEFSRYAANPLEIFMTWKGGMSFHGGMLGVVVATLLYCRKAGLPLLRFADILAAVAPIGLCLGRIANFVNEELVGRVTNAPWGMVFPHWGSLPRHPSQLYEAVLEGIVLLIILHIGWRIPPIRNKPGCLTGLFLIGYGLARFLVEFVREPDALYTLFGLDLTTGQLLSLPMVAVGLIFVANAHSCDSRAVHLSPCGRGRHERQRNGG